MGALKIPIGTYHRSESGHECSIVLNQATRDSDFDPKKEFLPVSLKSNKELRNASEVKPVYWIWKDNTIKRIAFNSEAFAEKTFCNSMYNRV